MKLHKVHFLVGALLAFASLFSVQNGFAQAQQDIPAARQEIKNQKTKLEEAAKDISAWAFSTRMAAYTEIFRICTETTYIAVKLYGLNIISEHAEVVTWTDRNISLSDDDLVARFIFEIAAKSKSVAVHLSAIEHLRKIAPSFLELKDRRQEDMADLTVFMSSIAVLSESRIVQNHVVDLYLKELDNLSQKKMGRLIDAEESISSLVAISIFSSNDDLRKKVLSKILDLSRVFPGGTSVREAFSLASEILSNPDLLISHKWVVEHGFQESKFLHQFRRIFRAASVKSLVNNSKLHSKIYSQVLWQFMELQDHPAPWISSSDDNPKTNYSF